MQGQEYREERTLPQELATGIGAGKNEHALSCARASRVTRQAR